MSASPREFTIVSGAHSGATFALDEGLLLIGADTGCDIWLSDAGLASRHAAVTADGRGVAIRAIEGRVSVNGKPLAASGSVALEPGSEIALGDSGVHLRFGRQSEPAAIEASKEPASRRSTGRPRVIAASAFVVAGLLVAGFSTQQLRPGRNEAAAATPPAPTVKPAVPTDAEIIEQVRDVFRTHGYDAAITSLGHARFRIDNLDASHERVRRAAAQTRADVPALKSLTFASPDTSEPPDEAPLYESAPDDRLSIHVEGETAYLSSGDGGRYFVGSVLPNGYTVRRITSRAIEVDREGQISWLRF
jgi:type III secretion protein D